MAEDQLTIEDTSVNGWSDKDAHVLPRLDSAQIEKKFIALRDEWKAKRGHHSATLKLVMHSAYQQIIGLGPDVIPLLLRELATTPDRWYWALRALTGEDPVPAEDRGDSAAMVRSRLEWGKKKGYRW